jgi:hypothetical protein
MDTRTESLILIAAGPALGLSGVASGAIVLTGYGVIIVPALAVLIVGVVRCWPRGWSTRDTHSHRSPRRPGGRGSLPTSFPGMMALPCTRLRPLYASFSVLILRVAGIPSMRRTDQNKEVAL